ncbi:hypothetical protein ACFWAP_26735 [Streptomyces goshikiensis]|uniref:hypothetical protein n=1 Tax=Streptomyces goshikiensis TaxID=1942 RepID=UPI0036649999
MARIEKEGAADMAQLKSEKSAVTEALRLRMEKSLTAVISSPENSTLLKRVQIAYEHRRQFPWLFESDEYMGGGNGVAGALRWALSWYSPSRNQEASARDDSLEGADLEWVGQVTAAVPEAAKDDTAISLFRRSISHEQGDIKNLNDDELQKQLVLALRQYYECREDELYI